MRKPLVILACLGTLLFSLHLSASTEAPLVIPKTVVFKGNIVYSGENTPSNLRQLDYYLPAKTKNFPLIIWFHGGGLTAGTKNNLPDKTLALRFAEQGLGIALVDYRLNPSVRFPTYVEDAAAATAFVLKNSKKLKAKAIFVAGYSAGAYLTALLALDPSYLQAAGVNHDQLAGFISISGQMSTHFTVRAERGQANAPVIVDAAAPLFYAKPNPPPLLLLIGDNDWPARLEENQLLFAQLTQVNHSQNTHFQIIPNRTHSSISDQLFTADDPAGIAIKNFIERYWLKN